MVSLSELWIYVVVGMTVYLTLPLLVFAHELGHAIPALVAGDGAHISIGSTDGRTASIGSLSVTIGREGVLSPTYYGVCQWSGVESSLATLLTHLGGPAVSITVAGVLGLALTLVTQNAIRFGVLFLLYNQLLVAILTLVPIEYPRWFGQYAGMTSDGYKALHTVRS